MDRARRLRDIGRNRGRYQSKFQRRHDPKTRRARPIRRHCVWESLFMRKSSKEKREIIQRPWELPMAAQHLSALLIQKRVRGMLCRQHLRQGAHKRVDTAPRASSRARILSPMQRFVATRNGSFTDDAGFRHFVATIIQAWYRKEVFRWRYSMQRFPVYHIAAMQIQYTWKAFCQQKLAKYFGLPPRVRAALIIQTAWKSYTHRRIFRYYHDLITFRNAGDPSQMLRAINPAEASLLDASMGAHVRFRLGGVSFPPTIYYKIFTKRAVCDLNAFSPKDYTIARQVAPTCHSNQPKSCRKQKASRFFIRVGNSYYRARQAAEETKNWYKRMENNGWRPVTAKVLAEANADPIAAATSKKVVENHHHSKIVRRQDIERQRRLKKRQWMHKLYTQGLLKETPGAAAMVAAHPELSGELLFDVDFENEHWEEEAEELFQWASALDYDDYQEDWQELGKTASTDAHASL